MQLELWVEPSSAGPGRTAVEKIMLMLYAENTSNGGKLFFSSLADNEVQPTASF